MNGELTLDEEKTKPQKTIQNGKPKWLKTKFPTGANYHQIKADLRAKNLYTVCEEAKCPNIAECWGARTATFMILGDTCTRACRFCNVKTGDPQGWLDAEEPQKVARSVATMKLAFAVITMVDRDDLSDFGASHIIKVFAAIRELTPPIIIEFLSGDMAGNSDALRALLNEARPQVFAHNLETVKELTPRVRDARATYARSLRVLEQAKQLANYAVVTKSALMLGLGETRQQIESALRDMRSAQVDIVNIGQYLRPSKKHLSIKRFVDPAEFDDIRSFAYSIGFKGVASGPLVRSSYKARELFESAVGTNPQKAPI